MTESPEPSERRKPTLDERVAWSPPSSGAFAYVPRRVLVRGDEAVRRVEGIAGSGTARDDLGGRDDAPEAGWVRFTDVEDELRVVALLRADGYDAQPDHVLFAHGECCCRPHPALTFDGLWGDPFKANPFKANPFKANPFKANPFKANQTSSALPAARREFADRRLAGPGSHPRITVLDTGLAHGVQRPALLADPRIDGDADDPDAVLVSHGTATAPDAWLDPVAGHGTFIAGLIEQLAPGCQVDVRRVISPLGDARESDVVLALLREATRPDPPQLVSLSFGGTALAGAPALRSAIALLQLRGTVVVASAGNDGTCEPQYPAAYEGVVAVGALGPDGPAPWTNYGDWVDACAPGTDLVSAFFADFDGPMPTVNTADADRFGGWACWSGTSFAAPVVVAALAREMVLGASSARDAVRRLVHAPSSLRLRGLGTVVTA